MDRDRCLFMVLFTIPNAVVLSMWNGVAGWGWPSSVRISHTIFACFAFKNNAPSSASAADDTTCFIITHNECIGPFKNIGFLLMGMEPNKEFPTALLRALGALGAIRYDTLKCICRIMSDA